MRGFALCVLLASAAVFRAEISHASTGKGPKESTQYCSAGGCETIDVEHDLETVSDSGLTGSLFSFAGNARATVKRLVQSTDVYKKVRQFAEQTTQYVKITIEKTAQYFEDLRSAIREEFYKLMEALWERSMGALFSEPGELKGAKMRSHSKAHFQPTRRPLLDSWLQAPILVCVCNQCGA